MGDHDRAAVPPLIAAAERSDRRNLLVIGLVAALVLALIVLSNGGDEAGELDTNDAANSADPLWARLEVPEVIVAGDQPMGEVVVENNTGENIRATGCGTLFQVRLYSDGVRSLDVAWNDCLEDFIVPTGTSRWPVHVPTTLLNPDGVLPPGEYEARIHQRTTHIPAEAVTVNIVERA